MIPPSQANSLDDYLALRYKIELIPDDAKRGWMSACLDNGYPIPQPTVGKR